MKQTFVAAVVAYGFLIGAGCNPNKSETPGGQASTEFNLSPPSTSTHLKANSNKDVSVGINRKDKDGKETVTVSIADVPKGLKVEPMSKTAEANIKEVVFKVMAEAEAQPGDYVIKVSGKPQTGKENVADIKITVDKP